MADQRFKIPESNPSHPDFLSGFRRGIFTENHLSLRIGCSGNESAIERTSRM